MSRLTILSEQSFKYLAYTPMHNLAGVFGTQWELSWRRKEKNIDAGDDVSSSQYVPQWNLYFDCRCNFRRKPHHAGDNVIMPESFPAQVPTDAEPESSVLDLPREDLDEARKQIVSISSSLSHACISSCILC